MQHILIVEDEPSIADVLIYALETECFEVTHCLTGQDAKKSLAEHSYDLAVLDVGLPDTTGFDLCREIRASSEMPVLFLTARDSEIDKVLGLELGGDDYVSKPFSPREVTARIRAVLRRSGARSVSPEPSKQNQLFLSDDSKRCTILCFGEPLPLTAHEYKLLRALLSQPGRVFTREQLLEIAWEDPGSALDRTIDTHVKSLRAKIRELAPDEVDPIQTRRGLGYVLEV